MQYKFLLSLRKNPLKSECIRLDEDDDTDSLQLNSLYRLQDGDDEEEGKVGGSIQGCVLPSECVDYKAVKSFITLQYVHILKCLWFSSVKMMKTG